ncbi:MAG TPA: methyl-accepting chemotaxis protein [Kineosporiaceae bacterium]|nr:methyl-accepting chemotaxis protein [Kineosporiaceae bacterium]
MSGHTLARHGNVLEFTFHGVWGDAERAAWEREIVPLMKSMEPGFQFFVDFSDYPAQESATQDLHGRLMGVALAQGLGQAVHVVPSAVVRTQMKRASDATPDGPRFQYASSIGEGRQLLRRARETAATPARPPGSPSLSPAPPSGRRPVAAHQPVGFAGRQPTRALVIGSAVTSLAAALVGPLAGAVPGSILALVAAGLALGQLMRTGREATPVGSEPASLGESAALDRGIRQVLGELAQSLAGESASLRQHSSVLVAIVDEVGANARQVEVDAVGISGRLVDVAGDARGMAATSTEIGSQTALADRLSGSASGQAGRTRQLVRDLDESSREIGNVVSLIDQIAEQTNMLALNATIEAARAGSAGRGFAVVAAEVKELSRATAAATGQIASKVTAIQRDVVSTVEAIDVIGSSIEEVRSAQDVVAEAVTGQQGVTAGIEDAVESTTLRVGELVERIRRLALSTSEVGTVAAEATETAERLDVLTQQLQEVARA